jgi:hypothetical protein
MITSERRRRRLFLVLLASLANLVAGSPAAADGADEQRAVTLFEKGRRLAREGKCAEAIAPLLESVRTVEGVGPLLNLGNCYETLGKTASALRYFSRAKEVATARSDPRKDEATQRAHALEKDVPTLLIRIPLALRPTAEVRVDEEPWPKDRWDVATPIDPGTHEIEVLSPPSPKQTETVTLKGKGDRAEWTAAVPAKTSSSRPTTGPEPEPERSVARKPASESEEPGASQRTVAFVAGGLGIGGLALGAVFGFQAINDHNAVVERCPTYPSCPESSRAQLERLNTSAENNGTISTVAVVSGIAFLAAGAILYLTAPTRPDPRANGIRALGLGFGSF